MNFNSISLLFPHQLYLHHPALSKERPVLMVEEFLFFKQYQFHAFKIILYRASMQYYKDFLQKKGFEVCYKESANSDCHIVDLISWLAKQGCQEIHLAVVVDNWLELRLLNVCKEYGIRVRWYESPGFLNTKLENQVFLSNSTKFFQAVFYKQQRISKNILLEKDSQPVGGQWSFDADNRKKIPRNETLPALYQVKKDKWIEEAINYTNQYFKTIAPLESAGLFPIDFPYPVTHAEAEKWLQHFLEFKFEKFGIYEDAMQAREPFLFHSVISPLLNIGLLTPQQVVDALLVKASTGLIPINSVEGFVRQIIGWREYIRLVYESVGSRQRTTNFFRFSRKIPASFYKGNTGIEPLDEVISTLNSYAYAHHIERLMVLGNFMLLCEFDPDEVYRYFMEFFIDSYDWVMVPNVYGMSQFSDGGLMTTKPYLCGSNYILKMSNFKKGPWCEIWDALFWRFLMVHRQVFENNPRWKMLLGTLDKMTEDKKQGYLKQANDFLDRMD